MEVESIAVIGAGAVGRCIAYEASFAGYRTVLEDVSRSTLERSVAWIKQTLEESVANGNIHARYRDTTLTLLKAASCAEDASREADLIIETVAEDMEMKIELFTIFDKFAKPGAIFATSATSLAVAEMAAMTVNPERCIGMRFSLPACRVKMLELVRGVDTSDETVAACCEVGRRIGREVSVVHEPSDGFAGGDSAACRQVADNEEGIKG